MNKDLPKVTLDNTDGFKKTTIDREIEKSIASHCETFHISSLEAVKHFPILARRQLLKRFFSHIELFKMVIDIPGDIAELGVFRGLGLFTWANLLESYCIGDRTKVVWGFDNWKGFIEISEKDRGINPEAGGVLNGFNPEIFFAEINSAINIFDHDRFIPQKPRIRLINGNIEESVPNFIHDNPGVRFSLVHFDCDMYKPTKIALESLWTKISRGGILIFDEYAIHDWPGETQAVDEFLQSHPNCKLKTFSWTNVPGAYLIKE